MSNSSIMSVRDMIDTAFGDLDANIVNFKLIQAVLYLIARQLRMLERKVEVQIQIERERMQTNLNVTEVKIHATVPKKRKKIKKAGGTDDDAEISEDNKISKHGFKSSISKPLSSSEKSALEKSSTTKSSSDKTTSEKTKSSTDKTSSDLTKSSTDRTSSDKTKSSTDKTSSDKTKSFTDKSSSEKTKSSTDKTSSTTTKSSTDKTSTEKTTSSSKKSSSAKDTSSSDQYKKKDLSNLLEFIEEQREKELRVIHQRADSREVPEKTPTPMVSLDSVEEQYEKLLVVERVPVEKKRSSLGKRTPRLSIVTQEQFEALANVVRDLQTRFTPVGRPGFPENAQLMQDLRKGASLTDAMAALQLSARLEAAEKTLKEMMNLVTDLAIKSGLEIELKSKSAPDGINVLHEATGTSTPIPSRSKKSIASKRSKLAAKSDIKPISFDSLEVTEPSSEPSKIDTMPTPSSMPGHEEDTFAVPVQWITYDELQKAIQEVRDGLIKTLTGLTTQSNVIADNALRTANRLEEKLESSLNLGTRMNDLELHVSAFSEQVTVLDTGLSSQMTTYQEQLTQMQHDLEAGLEAMAEALANTGGDTAAVAELNAHFTNLHNDVDSANSRQKDLMESQKGLSQDLEALRRQIEMLRELKSDRDEVADALRDKAGLGALNGLVALEQFNAVRGDFEKRIGAAYDKFNNQEITWQKAIDDLLRELNDKADWLQVIGLRDDVNKNFDMLNSRTRAMLEIVGEPRTAATTRKLFRDDACLSCSTPAHMDMEEPRTVSKLPAFSGPLTRPPTIGAEDTSKPAEDGDHRVCYPGLPIPHPRDLRSHICHRYCGGSHTLVMDKKSRSPIGLIVTPISKRVTTGVGSDGKTYILDETIPVKKPCLPCNEKKITAPQPSEAESVLEKQELGSDMTPSDFIPTLCSVDEPIDNSVTPPPPTDDF